MEFYESLVSQFLESVRSAAGPSREEQRELALELMKEASCRALWEIREILRDDTLEDPVCFYKIERIVEVYEALGLDAGGRHDFD